MTIIRLKDTPMVASREPSLQKELNGARSGPALDLSWGWEPDWKPSH